MKKSKQIKLLHKRIRFLNKQLNEANKKLLQSQFIEELNQITK